MLNLAEFRSRDWLPWACLAAPGVALNKDGSFQRTVRLRRVVARNLRRIRRERGLSQEELADRASLNRNYVGMIEREENAPTVDALEQLSDALISP